MTSRTPMAEGIAKVLSCARNLSSCCCTCFGCIYI